MVRGKMSRTNKFKQSLMTKQGKGILLIVAIAVFFLFGSTMFSAFDLSKVAVGVTAKTAVVVVLGDTLDEAAMAADGHTLYFMLYGYRFDVDDPVGATTPADSSVCKLVCTENNAVVGEGTAGKSVVRVAPAPDEVWYEITPYFTIDVSGVYKYTHDYKLVISGTVVGETYTFAIVGDADSPIYSEDDGEDDNGDDNGDDGDNGILPTEPEFIETPDDATFENSTPSDATLTWVVEDDNLAHYYLYFNDTLVIDGAILLNEFTYVVEIFDYGVGVYVFEFEVVDGDNNTISDEVIITVVEEGEMPSDIMAWIEDNPLIAAGIGLIAVFLLVGGSSAKGREIIVLNR